MNSDERFISETPMVGCFAAFPTFSELLLDRLHPAAKHSSRPIAVVAQNFLMIKVMRSDWSFTVLLQKRGPHSSSKASTLLLKPLPAVHPYRADDDHTFDDLLVIRRDIQQVQAIVDDAHQK